MPAEGATRLLLADACVLIDFLASGADLLLRLSQGLGTLHVASPVLMEVEGLDEDGCSELGIVVIDPSPVQADEAARARGGLSFPDRVCLVVARDGAMTCLTNDAPLRRACADAGVSTMRSLRCLLELTRLGRMSPAEALRVAEAMHRSNPRHVGAEIVAAFVRELRGLHPGMCP